MSKYLAIILINFFFISLSHADEFKNVEQYISVNKYSLALQTLKKISPQNKEEVARQSYLIGEIYFALGNVTKAEDFFSDANMKSPMNGTYGSAYAKAMMALGKFNEAKELATRILEEDFNVIESHIVLATIDERLGNLNKAKNRFEELIRLQPQSEIMHVAYAEFLDVRVNSYDAINLLKKYIKRYPESPKALDYLGNTYAYLDDIENAIIYRSKAAELYELRGQQIYSNSINEWLSEYEKKTKAIEEDNKNEIVEEEIVEEEIVEEEIVTQTQKPALKYQDPNLIDPWPIKSGEYAYTGSGFITSKGGEIITNRHVIEGAKRLYVRNGLGELRAAEILKLSETDDIALLKLDEPFNSEFSIEIPINYPAKPGQEAFVIGYPLADILGENKPSITQGIISKSTGMYDDPNTFQITAKLNQGNSGGPIFTREGNILGIAVAKIDKTLMLQEEGMIPEDVNFGIPSNRIEALTGKASEKIYSQDLDLEVLYESVLPSVVMILNVVNVQE
jgi:serine protease Do